MPYAAGGLSIDYARRRVDLAGEPVDLTATEYAVPCQLAVHAPRVLNHQALLQRVWGPERLGEGWLLRNVVKKPRRELGDDAADPRYIITEHGWGTGWGGARKRRERPSHLGLRYNLSRLYAQQDSQLKSKVSRGVLPHGKPEAKSSSGALVSCLLTERLADNLVCQPRGRIGMTVSPSVGGTTVANTTLDLSSG